MDKKDLSTLDVILGTVHHFPTEDNPVYLREMLIPKGMYVHTHKHNQDHFSIMSGHVIVDIDGCRTEYKGHKVIEIKAGALHTVTALEDTSWFCVHASSQINENNVDEVLIKGD